MAASGSFERAGVVVDEEGYTVIPATQRPDGTWRKARRVKDGYIPQEEMPVYESRGTQWIKSKPTLPPGLHVDENAASSNTCTIFLSKAAKKNLKRKEKKKQAQDVQAVTQSLSKATIDNKQIDEQNNTPAVVSETTTTTNTDLNKKLKNLRKKLRQIEELQSKIDSGELKEPSKEQLEKLAKKSVVEDEIEDIELQLEGL